jgi:hypothetical protein
MAINWLLTSGIPQLERAARATTTLGETLQVLGLAPLGLCPALARPALQVGITNPVQKPLPAVLARACRPGPSRSHACHDYDVAVDRLVPERDEALVLR